MNCPVTNDFNEYDAEQTSLEEIQEFRGAIRETMDEIDHHLIVLTPENLVKARKKADELHELINGRCE